MATFTRATATILSALADSIKQLDRSDLDKALMNPSDGVRYLCANLHVTPLQAMLLAVLIEEGITSISDLKGHLKLPTASILALFDELDKLHLMGYTVRNSHCEMEYRPSTGALRMFRANRGLPPYHEVYANDALLLDYLRKVGAERVRDDKGIPYDAWRFRIAEALRRNSELPLAKRLLALPEEECSQLLGLYFGEKEEAGGSTGVYLRWLSHTNDQHEAFLKSLRNGSHYLLKEGLIQVVKCDEEDENDHEEGKDNPFGPFFNDDDVEPSMVVALTAKGEALITNEDEATIAPRREAMVKNAFVTASTADGTKKTAEKPRTPQLEVTRWEDITVKSLSYNPLEGQAIGQLQRTLDNEHYHRVTSSLAASGLRKGITVLMHGAPGTGKTESVLQLGRLTHRDVLSANMANIHDKYIGESEKNVKAIFKQYKKYAQSCEHAPILLLNEADGLLTKRLTNIDDRADASLNTMQTILLQSLETFEGVLIATTNLPSSLDKAFDRRFLIKVCFERPSAPVRAGIWRGQLPALALEQAQALAEGYDLSGGQIENVVRRYILDKALDGLDVTQAPDLNLLHQLCLSEEQTNRGRNHRTVGF